MAFQNFTIRNKSPVSVVVTEIKFYTPSGIRHVVDLGNFNGSTIFTGNTFSVPSTMAAGESKIISIDYEYVSGDNGARSGSIEIKTSANTSAFIKTTIIVDTDIILVPTPVPTPIPVPLPVPVPVPTPVPTPIPTPVGTSPPSPPPSPSPSTYCPITFSGSPTTLIRNVSPNQPQPATGDLVLSWTPTDPAITTGLHKVQFEYMEGFYGDGNTRYTFDYRGVKVTPAAENRNKATYKQEYWSKIFTEPGNYVIFMKLVQFKIILADGAEDLTNRVLCEKHVQILVNNPTGVTADTGVWQLTVKQPEYTWGDNIEFMFTYSKGGTNAIYPSELSNNSFWIGFASTNPALVRVSTNNERSTQVSAVNGKPILMTRSSVTRDQVNESATYDTVEVEAVVWTENPNDLGIFEWFGTQYRTKFKLVKTRSTASLPPPASSSTPTIYKRADGSNIIAPAAWSTFTQAQQIEWFNQNRITEAEALANGLNAADVAYLKSLGWTPPPPALPPGPPPPPPPGPPPPPPPPPSAEVAKSLTITPTTILAGGTYTVNLTGRGGSKVKWSLVAQPNPPSYDDEITLPSSGKFTVSASNAVQGIWDLYTKFEDGSVLKATLTVQANSTSGGPGTIGGTTDAREVT